MISPGAQFEISIDGLPRTYRDRKDLCLRRSKASELESAIVEHARAPLGGLVVIPEAFLTAHTLEIISLADRYHLPTVYSLRHFIELGGLLSYGNVILDNFRRAAIYADRIFKGAKPSELPVEAPEKFELVINLFQQFINSIVDAIGYGQITEAIGTA